MHLKETRRAQNGGKAFLQFQNKRPAWAFAQGVEAFVLLRDEPGLKALEGTVTLCAVRKPGLQVFGRRAALEVRESRTVKVLPQCVVITAWSPAISIVRMPWRMPFREGHSFILPIRAKRN